MSNIFLYHGLAQTQRQKFAGLAEVKTWIDAHLEDRKADGLTRFCEEPNGKVVPQFTLYFLAYEEPRPGESPWKVVVWETTASEHQRMNFESAEMAVKVFMEMLDMAIYMERE